MSIRAIPPSVTAFRASDIRAVQGHADLLVGIGEVVNEFPYWEFGGGARVNVPFGDQWNLQVDPQFVGVYGRNGETGTATDLAGFAHVYRRDDTWARGVYFGYDRLDYFGLPINVVTGGLEAQRYWSMTTLYGQAAYSHMSIPNCGSCDTGNAVMLRGELQHYFGDNTMIAGDLIWTHAWFDYGPNLDVLSAAVSATHRFNGSHIGIFGQARYDHYDPVALTLDDWRVLGGIRLFADQSGSTLRSHLVTGPGMNALPLPTFWPEFGGDR